MPQAVRFDQYGGIDVLRVVDVERPVPGPGEVLVRGKATSINPGEGKIRSGALAQQWPSTFPSGEGSDLAGIVDGRAGALPGFAIGDDVLGWTDNRAAHAELVLAHAEHLVPKPAGVSWEAAGSMYVAGATAYAMVRAVSVGQGDTVVVSGAAGGVGTIAVQLAKNAGAAVIGLASEQHHEWLSSHGVIPVTYGEGVADRIRSAAGTAVDAFLDTHGGGYVELALDLGVRAERIDTIAGCWRYRSPTSTRWTRCRTRTGSSSTGTRSERSFFDPDAPRAASAASGERQHGLGADRPEPGGEEGPDASRVARGDLGPQWRALRHQVPGGGGELAAEALALVAGLNLQRGPPAAGHPAADGHDRAGCLPDPDAVPVPQRPYHSGMAGGRGRGQHDLGRAGLRRGDAQQVSAVHAPPGRDGQGLQERRQ